MYPDIKNKPFLENIIDGMFDWVRVLDLDNNVIYMNKAMSDALGTHATGVKCYKLLGRSSPCENCTSSRALIDGNHHEKEEHIGNRVFSVMSSPLKNESGETVAIVEVLRDTTQLKRLYNELQSQNMKLRSELDMAKKLQSSMLPKAINDSRFCFSCRYLPCESIGGDFVDIFKIDASHIGLYIADVSGHGVPASLLTIFLSSSLNKKLLSPAKALEKLFASFNQSGLSEELYITLFYVIIDLDNKSLVYSNAGLNTFPILYGNTGFELIKHPGIPISSWIDKPLYKDGRMRFQTGDRLFLYTDGITEMRNSEGSFFSEERLFNILNESRSTPDKILADIEASMTSFIGVNARKTLQDDITMALIEMK
jgi:sigma-B regulation protein RsbU (phosphoserine phosphatase)